MFLGTTNQASSYSACILRYSPHTSYGNKPPISTRIIWFPRALNSFVLPNHKWVSCLLPRRVFALMELILTTCFLYDKLRCDSYFCSAGIFMDANPASLVGFASYAARSSTGRLISASNFSPSYSNPFVQIPNITRINLQHNAINDCIFFNGFPFRVV